MHLTYEICLADGNDPGHQAAVETCAAHQTPAGEYLVMPRR